jgi:hypothetical protein
MIKPLVYFLLTNTIDAFTFENVKEGPCSLKVGDGKGAKFDVNQIKGKWINHYDRKDLNEHYKCYGMDFDQASPPDEEDKEAAVRKQKFFEFSQHAMTKDQPSEENGDHIPHFKTIQGMQLNFDHGSDKTSAVVAPTAAIDFISLGSDNKHDGEGGVFDPMFFESQYRRSAEILHTDEFKNYMVLYQCMEKAKYNDLTHDEADLDDHETWKRAIKTNLDMT